MDESPSPTLKPNFFELKHLPWLAVQNTTNNLAALDNWIETTDHEASRNKSSQE